MNAVNFSLDSVSNKAERNEKKHPTTVETAVMVLSLQHMFASYNAFPLLCNVSTRLLPSTWGRRSAYHIYTFICLCLIVPLQSFVGRVWMCGRVKSMTLFQHIKPFILIRWATLHLLLDEYLLDCCAIMLVCFLSFSPCWHPSLSLSPYLSLSFSLSMCVFFNFVGI